MSGLKGRESSWFYPIKSKHALSDDRPAVLGHLRTEALGAICLARHAHCAHRGGPSRRDVHLLETGGCTCGLVEHRLGVAQIVGDCRGAEIVRRHGLVVRTGATLLIRLLRAEIGL